MQPFHTLRTLHTLLTLPALPALPALASAASLALTVAVHAAPQIAPGAYRIDVNGSVRTLCADEIANAELSARGWRERLAEQGVRCDLSDVKTRGTDASWRGRCSAPGMGKVLQTQHQVSVRVNTDKSFDLLTVLTGDLQARIPVRGERLTVNGGRCTSEHDTFRPWK